ncbi:unnamed protein product, partial [Laminaria digitata]
LNRDKQSGLVARARTLYAALDLKLSCGGGGGGGEGGQKNPYFFGATPTSLDACVFGHLAEAWTIRALLDILPAYENLSRFFRRLCDEYFSPGWSPPPHPAPPSTAAGGGGGVSESKAGTGGGDGEDRGGGGEGDGGDALREAMMHADYVNSLNAFNQL